MSRQGWTRPIVFLSRQCGAALRPTEKARHTPHGWARATNTTKRARQRFSVVTDFIEWEKKNKNKGPSGYGVLHLFLI